MRSLSESVYYFIYCCKRARFTSNSATISTMAAALAPGSAGQTTISPITETKTKTEQEMVVAGDRKEAAELAQRWAGLQQSPKNLFGCHYLYDEWGSANYDAACDGDYYLYAAERQLLRTKAEAIATAASPVQHIVDIGCGSGAKIVPLLNAFAGTSTTKRLHYYPVDQSHEFLSIVQQNIARETCGRVQTVPVPASYDTYDTKQVFERLRSCIDDESPVLFCIFGSELCCMQNEVLRHLLSGLAAFMRPAHDSLLIGYDPLNRQGHTQLHVQSYGSAKSHEWFCHIVHGLGRSLGADPPLLSLQFEYEPVFEHVSQCPLLQPWSSGVVHYLRSRQTRRIRATKVGDGVASAANEVLMDANERMYMLHSAKPSPEEFDEVMGRFGFAQRQHWTGGSGAGRDVSSGGEMTLALMKVEEKPPQQSY